MLPALPLYLGIAPGWSWVGAVLGGALGAGYSGVTPALVTQIFDDRVRARAIGFVYHAGALIAAFVPTSIPLLSAHTRLSLAGATAVVVGFGLVALASSVYLLRRTITAPSGAVSEAVVQVAVPAADAEVSPAAASASRPASPDRRPAASIA